MEYREYELVRYQNDVFSEITDIVASETHFDVFCNGRQAGYLICTDQDIEELVTGHLYDLGLIESAAQITAIRRTDGEINRLDVSLLAADGATFPPGRGSDAPEADFTILFPAFKEFEDRSRLFRATGAVHSAGVWDGGGLISFFEDIGRHNTINKVVGSLLREGLTGAGRVLFISSRLPREIVLRAARIGFKTIIAISAPTDLGIETAKEYDIALVGMVRGNKFNIYNGYERLVKQSESLERVER